MATAKQRLKVVTYNVWQGQKSRQQDWDIPDKRYKEAVKIAFKEDPDVICFQECTIEFVPILSTTKGIKKYWQSKYSFRTCLYDTIILIHKTRCQNARAADIDEQEMVEIMGRGFKLAEFEKFGFKFVVGNVHLEMLSSLGTNIANRRTKLEYALNSVVKYPQKLLCGDFNFAATSEHSQPIKDSVMEDAWEILKPNKPGYTDDTDKNRMRYRIKPRKSRRRVDRILYHGYAMTPKTIKLIGREPTDVIAPERISYKMVKTNNVGELGELDLKLWPSDHFGVSAMFELEEEESESL